MVMFSCSACGESLRKKDVDKHYQFKCRNCEMLTCIDCNKDFWGDDFRSHTKCLTSEEVKYGAISKSDFSKPKGDVKQEQWLNQIRTALASRNLKPNVRSVLTQISSLDNVPRKKPKFINFVKSTLKMHHGPTIDEVWSILESTKKEGQEKEGDDSDSKRKRQESVTSNDGDQKKKRTVSNCEVEESDESQQQSVLNKHGSFKWKKTIEAVLREVEGFEMKEKKLRKKVFSEYQSMMEDSSHQLTEEQLIAKFNKSLKSRHFRILGDKVKLTKIDQASNEDDADE